MFGPPVPSADLPASVREQPTRTSRSERRRQHAGEAAGVLLVEHLDEVVAGLLVSPGSGGGSKLFDLAVAEADERVRRGDAASGRT